MYIGSPHFDQTRWTVAGKRRFVVGERSSDALAQVLVTVCAKIFEVVVF
jgi:hypothetical protein